MKIIAAILALCAAPALACNTPATGTLEDMMKQAIWTEAVGTANTNRQVTVHVALPALNVAGYDCLTWDVEIVLPPGFRMRRRDGDILPTAVTGLAAAAHHVFSVDMPGRDHISSRETVRGWLRVKVRNPLADAGVYLATASGSPLWLYPIQFHVHSA